MSDINVDIDKLREASRSYKQIAEKLKDIRKELKEIEEPLFKTGVRRVRRELLLTDEAIDHLFRCFCIIEDQSMELKRIANDIDDAFREPLKEKT